jgi:hypothetical protein
MSTRAIENGTHPSLEHVLAQCTRNVGDVSHYRLEHVLKHSRLDGCLGVSCTTEGPHEVGILAGNSRGSYSPPS